MEIEKDKVMHAVVSGFVAAGIAIVIANTGASAFSACLAGFLGAIACGLGKEYGDQSHEKSWSWADIAADAVGAVVGCFAGCVALLI